jgi:methionyl-tRNA synthetase
MQCLGAGSCCASAAQSAPSAPTVCLLYQRDYLYWLLAYLHEHPSFVQPEICRNEVLGFLRKPLGDLCISRPAERLNWGTPCPLTQAMSVTSGSMRRSIT